MLKKLNISYSYENDGKQVGSQGTTVFGQNREVYIEPHYSKDENGNYVENTEEHYKALLSSPQNIRDVKGFFRIQDIDRIAREGNGSKYIGDLKYNNESGKPFRHFDEDFKRRYTRKLKEEKDFRAQTSGNVYMPGDGNDVYKNWLKNEDERSRGSYNLSDKKNVR